MGATGTLLVYSLIGLAVGGAAGLRELSRGALPALATFACAALFWPLFAAFLLGGRREPRGPASVGRAADRGALARSPRAEQVRAVQARLLAALARLDGLAEAVVAPEVARVRSLAAAMAAMDQRIVEMDALLAAPGLSEAAVRGCLQDLLGRGVAEADARLASVRARLRNLERLRALRERTREDLERIVLKLEELCSQLHLLEFAARPEAEVVRSIKEIAEGIEALAEGMLAQDEA